MSGALSTVIALGYSLSVRLRWFGIPVSLGVTCLALLQLRRSLRRGTTNPASPQPLTWQLVAFCQLPSRVLSRSWGKLMDRELPTWLRRPLLGLYVWMYRCNMSEAEESDLRKYASFSELFVRRLREGTRAIDSAHMLVSPVDGRVLNCGTVEGNHVEQVKGVHYSLDAFLGPGELTSTGHTAARTAARSTTAEEVAPKEKRKEEEEEVEKQLYHVVIYLAPGDCHHFHSPTEWRAQLCRHIPGELLTVAPWAAHKMPGLFALNERILLAGVWPHGLFTFTAVGAYNVGSIALCLEEVKNLQTNKKGRYQFGSFSDTPLSAAGDKGVALSRGDRVGVFKLGSSVVLLFEAPRGFTFVVKPGQKVFHGQPLGHIARPHHPTGSPK